LIGRYSDGEDGEERHDNSALLSREGLAGLAQHVDGIGPHLAHLLVVEPDGTMKPGDVVRHAHEAGLVVHAYTFRVDALPAFAGSPEALLALLFGDLKIDGLFADQPDVVLDYLGRARIRRTP
jgi:glycerophosphoryl diester phosphodiesterase